MAKKPVIEIGETVPRSLKFGIIVAIVIFWAQFLRTLLVDILFSLLNTDSPVAVDFMLAVTATALGYLILAAYRKITSKLRKIKV